MQIDDSLIGVPCLEDAIDRHPLVVSPDAPLTDVVALMSQTLGNSCFVSGVDAKSKTNSQRGARSSCVLVMQRTELLGIFTERDIVKLTAVGADFATVKIAEVMAHPVITLSEESFQDIFAPLFLFRRYRIRHLAIVDEYKHMVGTVSPESIRQVLRPSNLLKMRRVSEVMTTEVIHGPPTASVISLAQMMATHRVSCIVIVVKETLQDVLPAFKPVGIVTERDIVQYQALGLNLRETEAKVVMSTPLFLLDPNDSLWFAHQQMQRRHLQRLVVSWDWGAKLGIVTQSSLLRIFDPLEIYGVVETLQQTIVQLENEKAEYLREQNIADEATVIKNTSQLESEDAIVSENLDTLVSSIKNRIEHLLDNPDLPVDIRQTYLNSALKDIQEVALQNRNKN
ncbi:MAG: CBS domain-containing protein [Cyanobacteria bacterium P01_D01_bin.50]